MGGGTKEKPYTFDDTVRLIAEKGGPEGLNLSGKYFKEGIDLRGLDLKGIILKKAIFAYSYRKSTKEFTIISFGESAHLEGANLQQAHLEGADLRQAHLEKAYLWDIHLEGADLEHACLEGAYLSGADFEGADLSFACLKKANLSGANLERANLQQAHLEGANLSGADLQKAALHEAKLSRDTKLENVNWGNFIMGEKKWGLFGWAAAIYRNLKIWHTEHGLYDIAGKFYYREKEAERKAQSWKKPHLKLWSWVLRILCGYGEKPERVIISAAAIVFGLAAAYFLWGSFSSTSFWDTLYYSVTSFTALGYGQWAPQPTGWAKGVGAAEAVLGVSMLALFLVTFTRKMIR